MKNILAENMLRFGVKNLSKTQLSELSKIVEQQEVSRGNITLNIDLLTKSAKEPVLIINTDETYSVFSQKGTPIAGDVACHNGRASIIQLGTSDTGETTPTYVIIGQIGQLDAKLTIQNISKSYYIFKMNPVPQPETGVGNRAIKVAGPLSPINPITSIATICKMVGKVNPIAFYTNNSILLKALFKTPEAQAAGVVAELLNRVDIDKQITDAITKIK